MANTSNLESVMSEKELNIKILVEKYAKQDQELVKQKENSKIVCIKNMLGISIIDGVFIDASIYLTSLQFLFHNGIITARGIIKYMFRMVSSLFNLVSRDIDLKYFNMFKTIFEMDSGIYKYLLKARKAFPLVLVKRLRLKYYYLFFKVKECMSLSKSNRTYVTMSLDMDKSKQSQKILDTLPTLFTVAKLTFYYLSKFISYSINNNQFFLIKKTGYYKSPFKVYVSGFLLRIRNKHYINYKREKELKFTRAYINEALTKLTNILIPNKLQPFILENSSKFLPAVFLSRFYWTKVFNQPLSTISHSSTSTYISSQAVAFNINKRNYSMHHKPNIAIDFLSQYNAKRVAKSLSKVDKSNYKRLVNYIVKMIIQFHKDKRYLELYIKNDGTPREDYVQFLILYVLYALTSSNQRTPITQSLYEDVFKKTYSSLKLRDISDAEELEEAIGIAESLTMLWEKEFPHLFPYVFNKPVRP